MFVYLSIALYIIGIFPIYMFTNEVAPLNNKWEHIMFAIFWPIAMLASILMGVSMALFKRIKRKI